MAAASDVNEDVADRAVTDDGQNNAEPYDGIEEREDLIEGMIIEAATKIQASFRGMQVRRRLTGTVIDGSAIDGVVETKSDGHVDANE